MAKKPFFIGGTASFLAYVMRCTCLHAPVAIVSSLRETSVIFAMILGVFLLGEQISRQKVIVILIMISCYHHADILGLLNTIMLRVKM